MIAQLIRETELRKGKKQLLRDYLRGLAGEEPAEVVAEELLDLMEKHGGRSGGRRIRRDEAYEGRV